VPRFVSIAPVSFSNHDWQPPSTDHHSSDPPSSGFSAYKTAQTTIRWRHSPSDPSELQSNARILRWSDGSLTLQLASDPTVQYEIAPKALAPPQRNPPKPTPTSIHDKTGRTTHNNTYDEKADSYTYLATASAEEYMVRVTNKITTSLLVIPSRDGSDEALERLQSSMMAATQGPNARVELQTEVADPEQVRRAAEQAEKERTKAQRKLEMSRAKEMDRATKVFGRTNARGGLTVGDLEEGERGSGSARRAPRAKPRRPRRDDYSDDDDEDIDAMIESREKEQRDRDREKERAATPKRDRPREDDDAEPAGTQDSPVRTKRRRVVEDDDDE
jgi:RNA polymerase-associated protein LEO1